MGGRSKLIDPPSEPPCLRPSSAEMMQGYPVTPLISSVRNDGPALVRPLAVS